MNLKPFAALVLSISVCCSVRSDDTANDAKKMDGTWQMASAETGTGPLPADFIKGTKLEIKDGKYTVTMGGNLIDKGTCKLGTAGKLKSIDITAGEGPNKGKTILAIYELDGDNLKVCYDLSGGKNRPTEFKAKSEAQILLVTYKRQ